MDFLQLEEYEAEFSNKLAVDYSSYDIDQLDIKKLYPEFTFSDTFGLRSTNISLNKYLLTYDQVIVNIIPFESTNEFQNSIGFSIEKFTELVELGKILPVICYPYDRYPSFYKTLFCKGPFPRSGRLRTYFEITQNKDKAAIIDEVTRLTKSANFSEAMNKYFKNYNGDKHELFINSFSSDLYDFQLLGMDELVNIIMAVSKTDPKLSHQLTYDYCDYLVRPLFDNLSGINTYTNENIAKAKSLYLNTKKINIDKDIYEKQGFSVTGIEQFMGINPVELVEFMSKEISFNFPVSMEDEIKFSSEMDNNLVVKEFRSKLASIKKGNFSTESIEDLSRISKDISDKLEKDSKRLSLASTWTTDIIMVGAILPSLAGQMMFDKTLMNLLYSTVYPTIVGTRYDSFKSFSEKITGSLFEKLFKKPMATTYWRSTKM